MKLTRLALLAVVSALALSPIAALAAVMDVNIQGSTNGGFNGAAPSASSTFLGLSYTDSTFNTTTSNGFSALGGNPSPGSNFNNLGSFTLAGTNTQYAGTFTLQVLFTSPAGIQGSSEAIYVANLTGSVTSTSNGGVFFDFTSPAQTFTFSNLDGSGSFTLTVNDLSLNAGQTASLTGNILASAVAIPEVTTFLPLAGVLGLAGLVEMRRRRKALAA